MACLKESSRGLGLRRSKLSKVRLTRKLAIRLLILKLGAINEIWALRKLPSAKPKLTYIIVGKRYADRYIL
jgi:hypothetical protein